MSKNLKLAINLLMIAGGMAGFAVASYKLYPIFCQVTGFGGTTQVAQILPTDIREREINVRFDTQEDPTLGWDFKVEQAQMKVRIGENGLAFFSAENKSDKDVVGMAKYNVTPLKVGKYFAKVECFCFEEQEIKAGEKIEFPVSFYIDPAFDDDKYMDDVDTITLSYIFYRVDGEK